MTLILPVDRHVNHPYLPLAPLLGLMQLHYQLQLHPNCHFLLAYQSLQGLVLQYQVEKEAVHQYLLQELLHIQAIEYTKQDSKPARIQTDAFIPLFGLSPKLGPIAKWGLEIEKNAIKVNNALDYQTNIPGIFAIGDVNTYPGKLKLILCGFHEATLMCQAAYKIINPGKRYVLKYTTVSGIDGFDGTRKEAPKSVVKSID